MKLWEEHKIKESFHFYYTSRNSLIKFIITINWHYSWCGSSSSIYMAEFSVLFLAY